MAELLQIDDLIQLQSEAAAALVQYITALKDRFVIKLSFDAPPPGDTGGSRTKKLANLNIYVTSEKGIKTKLTTLTLGDVYVDLVHPTTAQRTEIEKNIVEQVPAFKAPDVTTITPAPTAAPVLPRAPKAPAQSKVTKPEPVRTLYNTRAAVGTPEFAQNRELDKQVGALISNPNKRDIPADLVPRFYRGEISLEELSGLIAKTPTFNPKKGPVVKFK